ncbi:hypothetical protein HPB47_020739 [Ixodes persulcatus]|uniref:Uncharacterized protein n=1 Tax=Ixodes persulcatus TaxID=34615 RepID=A0AC60QEG8_IXOPE|nr:hypothetical protein HPB47_020739 [Ixodes persulcatus]
MESTPTKSEASTKVHQSATLPATAPGVPTRPQAVDPHQGPLHMVHCRNSENMKNQKLFNRPCLYGDVLKIKFSKKNDCAMEKIEDYPAKGRAVGHQSSVHFFDTKMQHGY